MKIIFWLSILTGFSFGVTAEPFSKVDNHEWVRVGEQSLTLDIYSPESSTKSPAPVIVIYHGGGWLVNNESIMDEMSAYLAEHGYVVANLNYRLLGDNDNTVTMNQIVEDVFGGLLWVKAHIAQYGGDPSRIAVTGDSAGGHLASMVVVAGRRLSSSGFEQPPLGFNPTWLPDGMTAEQVAGADGLKVQAAVISYGAFDLYKAASHGFESEQNGFWQWSGAAPRGIFGEGTGPDSHPELYRAVSPIFNIPNAKAYQLPPQLHHVGSKDTTTPQDAIKAYVDALLIAGQRAQMTVYPGYNHAYMDSGCLEVFGSCFDTHAVPVLEDILPFLAEHLSK